MLILSSPRHPQRVTKSRLGSISTINPLLRLFPSHRAAFVITQKLFKTSFFLMSATQENRGESKEELDAKARQGETVVPGGTGGKSLDAQERLAEGRSKGGQRRKEQIGEEGYKEMGRKGGLSSTDRSGGERAEEE